MAACPLPSPCLSFLMSWCGRWSEGRCDATERGVIGMSDRIRCDSASERCAMCASRAALDLEKRTATLCLDADWRAITSLDFCWAGDARRVA